MMRNSVNKKQSSRHIAGSGHEFLGTLRIKLGSGGKLSQDFTDVGSESWFHAEFHVSGFIRNTVP